MPDVIAMETAGVNKTFTVIVIPLLVAVSGLTQAALLIITTVTISLCANVADVNVDASVPAFIPFTCH